jgi:AcrR family transcriptional regulator
MARIAGPRQPVSAIDRGRMVHGVDGHALPLRSAAKRRDVLTAAWELFAARGFGGTGMRALAAEAGVSTATIYAHFPTKQELLRALVQQRWEEALTAMLTGATEIDDPLERLLFALTALNRAIADDPLLRQLLVTPRRVGDAHIDAQIGTIEDMMDARCAEAIRAAVEAKRLKCHDPDALAVLIRVSMQGWLLTESKRKRPMSEARVTGALVALLRAAKPTRERGDQP